MNTASPHEGPIPPPAELARMQIRARNRFPLAHRLAAYALRGGPAPMPGRCARKLAFAPDFPADTPPRYCMKRPLLRSDACRLHGGTKLMGAANPAYRTGEYSGLMQEGSALWKGYHRTQTDAELLSLSEQLRMLDGLYRQLVEQSLAGTGAGAEAWQAMVQGVVDTLTAAKAKNTAALSTCLLHLQELATPAAAALALRKEILEVGDHRRRLVETQARLLERGQHLFPMDQTIRYGATIAQCAVNAMVRGRDLRHALILFQRDLKWLEEGRSLEDAELVAELPA